MLARHCGHRDVSVRQASVFGLGIAAQSLGEAFEPAFPECYKAVEAVLAGPPPTPTDDDEFEATPRELKALSDNCFSAHGKMFSAVWAKLSDPQLDSLLARWLGGLPMLEDHKESIVNLKLLFWVLKTKPHALLGADFARLGKLLSVFAQVYHQKKISNAHLDAEIKQWTQQLVADERMKVIVVALPLDDHVKEFMNSVVTSA